MSWRDWLLFYSRSALVARGSVEAAGSSQCQNRDPGSSAIAFCGAASSVRLPLCLAMEVKREEAVELRLSSDGSGLCLRGATSTSSFTHEASLPLQSSAGMVAILQPPVRRPSTKPVAGARRSLAAKWYVPGGLEVTSGCGSSSEVGCSSNLASILGGDTSRTPAFCGGDTIGLDCFSSFFS